MEIRDWFDKHINCRYASQDDMKVWEHVYHQRRKTGVFQFTAEGARRFCEDAKPTSIEELGALTAILLLVFKDSILGFVASVQVSLLKIVKEGDWIEVSGYSGTVKKISVRSTHLQTFNKATAIIKNSDIISSSVVNWMHDEVDRRVSVPIEVAYDSDIEKLKKILLDIAKYHPKVMEDPEPIVLFSDVSSRCEVKKGGVIHLSPSNGGLAAPRKHWLGG